VEPDRDGSIPPGVLESIAAIARKHETYAKTLGGLAERTNLISGRRREEKNALHTRSICSGAGSAQQYHPSVMYGGIAPFARAGRPSVPVASVRMRSNVSPREA